MINDYPCPNPAKGGGCGCPRSSSRCYGAIRAVREEFNRNFKEYGLMGACDLTLQACKPAWGWTQRELMERFLVVTQVKS